MTAAAVQTQSEPAGSFSRPLSFKTRPDYLIAGRCLAQPGGLMTVLKAEQDRQAGS